MTDACQMRGIAADLASDVPLTGLAYDARYITAKPSGIGQVCLELLRGLTAPGGQIQLHVLVNGDTRLPVDVRACPQVTFGVVDCSPYGVANQVLLPIHLRRHGIKLLHSVDGHCPLLARGVRQIVNVHDLIPLTCKSSLPRNFKSRHSWAWRRWLKLQCGRAAHIVTGSQHARRDIMSLLHVDAAKISVIPNPIRQWPRVEAPESLRRRLKLNERVISYVGRQQPYKNVLTLIRALPILNRWLDTRLSLVIAGDADERYPEPREEVRRLGLEDQVRFPGYLSEPSLGGLYRLSDVFVFPSLYEGFGMPPLEAMRFGTPVLAGLHASLPEVLGDAAFNVDTCDPHAVGWGVLGILRDPDLAARLRQAGLRQVERFSRHHAAREYTQLYRQVLTPAPVEAKVISLRIRVDATAHADALRARTSSSCS